MEDNSKFLMVLEHHNPQFDELPFSTARSWVEDGGVDVAMWLLYDSIHIVRREEIEEDSRDQGAGRFPAAEGGPDLRVRLLYPRLRADCEPLLSRDRCWQPKDLLLTCQPTQAALLLELSPTSFRVSSRGRGGVL